MPTTREMAVAYVDSIVGLINQHVENVRKLNEEIQKLQEHVKECKGVLEAENHDKVLTEGVA